MKNGSLKRKLFTEIEKLPEDVLPRILELVGKLKTKRKVTKLSAVSSKRRETTQNPLRELIGIGDVKPFAHKIDEDLYGK